MDIYDIKKTQELLALEEKLEMAHKKFMGTQRREKTKRSVKGFSNLLIVLVIVAAIYFGGTYVKANIGNVGAAINERAPWFAKGIKNLQSLFNGTGVASSAHVITSSADCLNITITDSDGVKHISPALTVGRCYIITATDQEWWSETMAIDANVEYLKTQITGDKTGIDVSAAITASVTTHILDLR